MAANDRFRKGISEAMDLLRARLIEFRNEAAIGIHTDIVIRTPIDTGRAKASWNIKGGADDPSVYPVVPEAGKLPREVAEAEAFSGHGRIRESRDAVVVISNNLPYITELENGKSRQAPSGMVMLTLTEFEANPAAFTREPF